MYDYWYPPRIGIDFDSDDIDECGYIPNLDLGDITRLVRILELAQQNNHFEKLRTHIIKPFKIGLTFEKELERRITLRARSDHLVIDYHGLHMKKLVEVGHRLSHEGTEKLILALKRLVTEYRRVVSEYIMTGKVDRKFR